MACQDRSILKTGKLSKVEKSEIKQLHVDSVEAVAGDFDTAEEEVVTQSADNALLQEVIGRASGYVEDTGVIQSESESDLMKWLEELNFKKLYGPFLWMGFNGLKARATLRRQFTFYH